MSRLRTRNRPTPTPRTGLPHRPHRPRAVHRRPTRPHPARGRPAPRTALTAAVCAAVLLTLATADPASAGTGAAVWAAKDLPAVIGSLQAWIMGILAAVATLYLVLAGVYYATAGGDPTQVERAKAALKSALVGYALAVLAPVLLQVVRGIVGG